MPTPTSEPNSADDRIDRIGYIVLYIVIGFLGLGFILGFLYITIRDYLNKRKVYTIEVPFPERVRLSTYDSSHPLQNGQTGCAVCLQKFAFTQICRSLPCGHTFCEEYMSECILICDDFLHRAY
jgi:hypothetical protein